MSLRLIALLGAVMAGGVIPAAAQMSPPPGSLQLPSRSGASSAPAPAPTPPTPAPRAPVQQVAPMASPPLPSSPAKTTAGTAKPAPKPPVVSP